MPGFRFLTLGCSVCLLFVASHARAATLSLEVADVSVAPNGVGEVAVMLTGASEALNLAGYEFRITPGAGTSSQLRFLEEDEGFLSAANYLFAGNSAAFDDGSPSSVGSVSTTSLPDDTFVGGDGTADFNDITATGTYLLVNLRVQHDAGPADPSTTFGHSFSIDLVPTSGDSMDFSNGGANSGFVDAGFGSVAFESTSGTVTLLVPEPTSLLLISFGMLGIAALRVQR